MSKASERPPLPRLLFGYEHTGCSTNTDVILPASLLRGLARTEEPMQVTIRKLAEQHAPTCPVCGTRMDFAVWGPHDDEVETRMAFGSRGGDAE